MLIEYGGLKLGDVVLYYDSNKGWIPAIIERFTLPEKSGGAPILSVVVLVTGFHGGTYPKEGVRHGDPEDEKCDHAGKWLTHAEAKIAVVKQEALRQKQLGNEAQAAEILKELELQKLKDAARQELEQIEPPAPPPPEETAKHKAKSGK